MPTVGGVSLVQVQEDVQVNVVNTAAAPVNTAESKLTGNWFYATGSSGQAQIPVGGRVLQITATAGTISAASLIINGGPSISIPAGSGLTIQPRGNLIAPLLVFTSTAGYFVEYVV